jgi:hypothetical protein
LDSLDKMPSRSRKADTRGVSIIPQNSNFIYNKFIKKLSLRGGAKRRRSNLNLYGDCHAASGGSQ